MSSMLFSSRILILIAAVAVVVAMVASVTAQPPAHCADYWSYFKNDNFLIDPCNSTLPFACVFTQSWGPTNKCFKTMAEAEVCAKGHTSLKGKAFDLNGCFTQSCPPCTADDCNTIGPANFCTWATSFTCVWPSPGAQEAYITPCQSEPNHWIDTSKCGKCCDLKACKRPPLSCPLMNHTRCQWRGGNYAVCPYDKPLTCHVQAFAPSACFSKTTEAPGQCFINYNGGASCADSRSCAVGTCSTPCPPSVCGNVSLLCPSTTPYQCTNSYGTHACAATASTFVHNTQCSDCCDGSQCQREPLVCSRPCNESQCNAAYSACDNDESDPVEYLVFGAAPQYGTATPKCLSKNGGALPKYKSKDAVSCCSAARSCTKQQCWKNTFKNCSQKECPQACSVQCQPCNTACGGNPCSSSCSPCPHCCGWAGCPSCSGCGMCFRDGNCFGECTCNTPGCPSPSFWPLLMKNFTNGFASDEERAPAQALLQKELVSGRVRLTSVVKELERLERFFPRNKH